MLIDATTTAALDRIAQRAADVGRAFSPGGIPASGDVAAAASASRPTLDPLSVAAPEHAYFVTSDDRGRTCYTRDGSFALHDGALVGANGRAIFGYAPGSGSPRALRVDEVDDALGRVRDLRVEPDGTVAYERAAVEPRSGKSQLQRVTVGRIALARFAAAAKPAAIDANHVTAPAGQPPHLGRPGDGNFGALTPFAREASGVDLDESLRKLKDAYLAFDALQAAHKAQGHLGKTAMDLLK